MSASRLNETIRFSVLNRLLHLFVMIGFTGLALTGFSLKFSEWSLAQALAWLLGGAAGLRSLHRISAVFTYGCVVIHLLWLIYYKLVLNGRITGPDTMFPRLKDLRDLFGHMAYMLGKRPGPAFERFSYWEKFDYWAILIGMNTMGLTGLVMWFPEFFARLFPGYLVNVAQVLHLYEAIMAVALKFVVHIVTTHLRPEVFPMDKSIFNGRAHGRRAKTALLVFLSLGCLRLLASDASAQGPALMEMKKDGTPRPCLDCHRLPNINTNEGAASSQAFCLECHGKGACKRGDGTSLMVALESFGKGRHVYAACITCHSDAARSPHISFAGARCTECHTIHDYSEAGDPHLRVQCQACHRKSPDVEYDKVRDLVVLAKSGQDGRRISLVDHGLADAASRETCRRCHRPGNKVGAASAILPGKNFTCIPCHGASAAPGHWSFIAALIVLIAGFGGSVILWLRGRVGEESTSVHRKISLIGEELWGALFSRRFVGIISAFVFDIILQRRLLKESPWRWFSHSLIYYGFLGRFFIALLAVGAYCLTPDGELAVGLLDKNNWANAMVNDVFGALIVLGVLIASLQRLVWRPQHVLSEGQDLLALVLIGIVAVGGFVLEGARIILTAIPEEKAAYSFIGYLTAAIIRPLSNDWQGVYGILWWTHAASWAALLAYLPFGKLRHLVLTPLSLLLRQGGRA
jgi:cytochrome b subunit of formate dehydrogenase/nitrate reductase gamma subunit